MNAQRGQLLPMAAQRQEQLLRRLQAREITPLVSMTNPFIQPHPLTTSTNHLSASERSHHAGETKICHKFCHRVLFLLPPSPLPLAHLLSGSLELTHPLSIAAEIACQRMKSLRECISLIRPPSPRLDPSPNPPFSMTLLEPSLSATSHRSISTLLSKVLPQLLPQPAPSSTQSLPLVSCAIVLLVLFCTHGDLLASGLFPGIADFTRVRGTFATKSRRREHTRD